MSCIHQSCSSIDKIWLPFKINGEIKGLKQHPYCIHCGAIKNISREKLRDIGYYMNVVARIDKQVYKISKSQMRLIAQELEKNNDFQDTYTMTWQAQDMIFINIVKKYSNLSEIQINSLLNG